MLEVPLVWRSGAGPWGTVAVRVRRGVAAGLSVVLGAAGLVSAGGAAYGGDALPCAEEAVTAADASVLAGRCGEPVEVLDQRTPWETWYALPDGQWRMEVSAKAVRARVGGVWVDVDTLLVRRPGGVAVVAPANPMAFSDGSPGVPLARIERDGHTLAFDVPFALPEPQVDGSQLTYAGVLPGVDLIVLVNDDGTGFSEVLRVGSPEAAADPRLDELAFDVEVSDGLELSAVDGGFEAVDGSGEAVFTSPAPVMWDSSADAAVAEAAGDWLTPTRVARVGRLASESAAARTVRPTDGDRVAAMGVALDDGVVELSPDVDMFTDPETVWPVYLDPTIVGSRVEWVSVRNDGYTDYNYSGDQGVGHCGTTGSPMYCSKVFTRRAAWQFRGLQAVGNAEPGDVQSAALSVYGTHSYSCTPYPVEAWWTGVISGATTWSTLSWIRPEQTQSLAHKPACGNARWIEFNVTEAGRETARYDADQLTVGLKATDESSSTGWKRYNFDAQLSITFNRAPDTPRDLAISWPTTVPCGGVVNSPNPILRATASDPNGDSIWTTFLVGNAAGATVWTAGTGWQASGTSFGVQVPSGVLADGAGYWFAVVATDTGGRSGPWSGRCTFTANTVEPEVVPTVTPVAGQPAVYAENARAGGVGVTGRFSFGPNGVGDVVSFRYGFDDLAMPLSVAVGGQVAYTPTSAGVHTLSVQSVDVGGLVGPRRDYQFVVDVPGSAGLWLFDEPGSSTTAGDASGAGHPLTLSSAGLRTTGMLAEVDPGAAPPGDGALHFATAADEAVSAAPVVSTDRSYTVTAFVKLDDLTGAQTAVSQSGAHTSAFELGYRPAGDAACPGGCWAFTLAGADSATAPSPTIVTSEVPAVAGQWTFLAAVYDAGAHQARLYVAESGAEPVSGGDVAFSPGWFATGPLVVGHGRFADVDAHGLRGAVDVVRVLTGVASQGELNQYALGSLGL